MADPAAALESLSVCVHASGQPEPFGQVIVEAMVRGIPVIATEGGGVTEILRPASGEELLGWLVPPHDVEALGAAITEALGEPAIARTRARAAWVSAQKRFSITQTAAAVHRAWISAVSPRRPA